MLEDHNQRNTVLIDGCIVPCFAHAAAAHKRSAHFKSSTPHSLLESDLGCDNVCTKTCHLAMKQSNFRKNADTPPGHKHHTSCFGPHSALEFCKKLKNNLRCATLSASSSLRQTRRTTFNLFAAMFRDATFILRLSCICSFRSAIADCRHCRSHSKLSTMRLPHMDLVRAHATA